MPAFQRGSLVEILCDLKILFDNVQLFGSGDGAGYREAHGVAQRFPGSKDTRLHRIPMSADRLHAQWRDATLVEHGQNLLLEAHTVGGIKGVQRHLNGIEGKASVEHGEMHIRVFMAGKANEAYFALLLGFEQSLCSATGSNEEIGIILKDDAMNLPQVEVISLETPQ